ncbi:MAG: hypothetical protein COA62_06885 [Rhodobiaceae bacterium]|nr:MAG: hypothetical protein COA62_06885 [Rhodobiaceae bacterium]
MNRASHFSLLLIWAFAASLVSARADQLVTDLSEHQISIRSNFTGTEVLIFGAVEVDDPDDFSTRRDIAVILSGPEGAVTVRRKDRVAGIWINYDAVTFARVPAFYAVASTRPLPLIMSQETRSIEGLGLEQISLGAATGTGPTGTETALEDDERAAFVTALLRNKERQGLYLSDPSGVAFLGRSLFRATIDIPANVPNGLYTAKVFLISDGIVTDAASAPLYVVKSGIERAIYGFARDKPLLYGIFAVVFATFAGWAATLIFRD